MVFVIRSYLVYDGVGDIVCGDMRFEFFCSKEFFDYGCFDLSGMDDIEGFFLLVFYFSMDFILVEGIYVV